MILSMYNQFYIFALTIVLGFIAGFIYDLFRIFRKEIKHHNILIQIEDILYWILVTFIMFKFVISKNNGETSFFLIFGMIIGMTLYFYTISPFFINLSLSIIHIINSALKTLLQILLTPVKIIINILKIPLGFLSGFLKPIKKKTGRILQKQKYLLKKKLRKIFSDLKIIFKKI